MKTIRILLIATVFITACGKPEKVKNAEQVVSAFFKALKIDDTATIKTLYPDFSKLPAHFKSDTFVITNYETSDNSIVIEVENSFTNKLKKTFTQKITLIVNDNESNMQITDSKNMCRFVGEDLYDFGQKTGCVSKDTTLSDQTKVKQMERAGEVLKEQAKVLVKELTDKVPLSDLKTKDVFGFFNGSAHIQNNSPYPLYYVKYKAIFTSADGTEIGSDDGFATVDTLQSGQGKDFTFFTQKPEGAAHFDVYLVYDNYFLLDCLKAKQWTGKECDNVKP